MFNRTQNSEFIKLKIMKLLKNSFLGTVFLLAIGSASIAGTSSTIEAEVAFFNCSDSHTRCNELYPDDFDGFDKCMGRADCNGEASIQSMSQ